MNSASLLKFAYLALVSGPAHERKIYRAMRQHAPKSIVEIGIGCGLRAERMIAVALRYAGGERLRYAGIDLFEARPAGNLGLSLKQAHQKLKATGVQVRLIPGDPLSALARSANALQGTDLLVISADQDQESLQRAWYYVPRMLQESSLVFIEHRKSARGKASLQVANYHEMERLAAAHASTRRAA